jgi:hypothetical protein
LGVPLKSSFQMGRFSSVQTYADTKGKLGAVPYEQTAAGSGGGGSVRVPKVENVSGSTAGAGSGDFHTYRKFRRVEAARVEEMSRRHDESLAEFAFRERQANFAAEAELRTARNAARRRAKAASRNAARHSSSKGEGGVKRQRSDSIDDSGDDEGEEAEDEEGDGDGGEDKLDEGKVEHDYKPSTVISSTELTAVLFDNAKSGASSAVAASTVAAAEAPVAAQAAAQTAAPAAADGDGGKSTACGSELSDDVAALLPSDGSFLSEFLLASAT